MVVGKLNIWGAGEGSHKIDGAISSKHAHKIFSLSSFSNFNLGVGRTVKFADKMLPERVLFLDWELFPVHKSELVISYQSKISMKGLFFKGKKRVISYQIELILHFIYVFVSVSEFPMDSFLSLFFNLGFYYWAGLFLIHSSCIFWVVYMEKLSILNANA